MKIIIFFILHIIGSIVTVMSHWRNGTLEFASKHGDGIRFAKPADIVFTDCMIWELLLVVAIADFIESYVNKKCIERFNNEREIS